MKSKDRNVDSMTGTVTRTRRRDPRRSPGLFFLHVLLIVLLLAVATAVVAMRSVSDDAKGEPAEVSVWAYKVEGGKIVPDQEIK